MTNEGHEPKQPRRRFVYLASWRLSVPKVAYTTPAVPSKIVWPIDPAEDDKK